LGSVSFLRDVAETSVCECLHEKMTPLREMCISEYCYFWHYAESRFHNSSREFLNSFHLGDMDIRQVSTVSYVTVVCH
jgi:hypothetical protein